MPQSFEQYLTVLLGKYQYPDQAKRDVWNALQHYRNLSPKLDQFVFNDGQKKELFCLDGTVPVTYKGNIYNIPVCIWLLDTHPYNSPMSYVKPTQDMQIKVSRHVDQNGRVFLPYLHEWNPNSSDLLGLIQVMIIVFGETPPVFSKPKQPDFSAPAPPYPTTRPLGYMPMPGVTASPPYPAATNSVNYPPPPVPPTSGYGPPGYPGYQSPTITTTSSTIYPPYPVYPPTSNFTVPSGGGYPYPPTTTVPTQQSTVPTSTGTITEEHIRASLLSAVEDKVKSRLKETLSGAQAEMDVLKKTHDELTGGKAKLEDIINRLEREQSELESSLQILRDKNEELKDLIAKMENQESIDIDEAVVTTAPLYKQLLNAFAEENATEDAIYYMGEALRKGVVDLDVFLKHVRELSRKQFMLRALMQKCREKAGLP